MICLLVNKKFVQLLLVMMILKNINFMLKMGYDLLFDQKGMVELWLVDVIFWV